MNLSGIFTAKSVAAFWNNFNAEANVQPYLGSTLFPAKKKIGLDLKWIIGEAGLPISLKATSFDALPEIRDRIAIQSIQSEMPFFREGFIIKESDRQEINRAKDSNDPYVQTVLQNVYNDAKNLIDGANVVPERMIMQLLSPEDGSPKIVISNGDVANVYNYDVDGNFAANNFKALSGTSMWSDHANSDPIENISDACDNVETRTGEKPSIMLLSKKTMKDLVQNAKLKSYILTKAQATGGTVRVTTNLVKQYLYDEFGITAIVYSKKFSDAGTTKSFYPDDMVTLLPTSPLGNTYYGTTPEESDLLANPEADVAVVNTGVAVTVITPAKIPLKTETYASEIVLPSFEGMNKVYVIKTYTKPTSTDKTPTGS